MTAEKFKEFLKCKQQDVEHSVRMTQVLLSTDDNKINQESFEILKTLGKGFFGKVFLA